MDIKFEKKNHCKFNVWSDNTGDLFFLCRNLSSFSSDEKRPNLFFWRPLNLKSRPVDLTKFLQILFSSCLVRLYLRKIRTLLPCSTFASRFAFSLWTLKAKSLAEFKKVYFTRPRIDFSLSTVKSLKITLSQIQMKFEVESKLGEFFALFSIFYCFVSNNASLANKYGQIRREIVEWISQVICLFRPIRHPTFLVDSLRKFDAFVPMSLKVLF